MQLEAEVGARPRFSVARRDVPIPICLQSLVWGRIMDLYLFRLSLKERRQPDLFEETDGARIPREHWIREYFSERRQFLHQGTQMEFVPEQPGTPFRADLIAGWIARARTLQEWTPPDQGLTPTIHESWRVALILVDPTEHEDGQKVALEHHPDIGSARAIIKSLVNDMNRRPPYSVDAFPIVQEASFWRFAERHAFQIRQLTFDVAVPNMFDSLDDFSDELRKLRDAKTTHSA